VRVFNIKGYDYNIRQIQDLRKSMGIFRRTINIAETAERHAKVVTLLADELKGDSSIDHFGRTLLHKWIRKHGIMIARLFIFFLFRTLLIML
jgi:hypothetical protein